MEHTTLELQRACRMGGGDHLRASTAQLCRCGDDGAVAASGAYQLHEALGLG